MQPQTIHLLNQLNKQFYHIVASDFAATRQQPWAGWQQLLPQLEELAQQYAPFRVLDIGCGNGRFAKFLAEKLSGAEIEYVGVDTSAELLEHAKKNPDLEKKEVFQVDVVEALLDFNSPARANLEGIANEFEYICAFGVLHHVPSYNLRKNLVEWCLAHLKKGGVFVATAWQFTHDRNLFSRQVPQQEMASRLQFPVDELEANDFFLTWERGNHAVRYCHLLDQHELDQLLKEIGNPSCSTFSADGKEGNLNRYIVIQKQ